MLSIGSLFSGIGGLEHGLELAGLGPVLWQVEQNEFCRRVLEQHWPQVDRSVVDVREAEGQPRPDLLCGGFPCQDISSAGTRSGLAGSRSGLWYEFSRLVEELHPRWVVVENVASGGNKWVDAVRRDLERLEYASLPVPIEARDVGAPHVRARIFLVAANPHHMPEQLFRQWRSTRPESAYQSAADFHLADPHRFRREILKTARLHVEGQTGDHADGRAPFPFPPECGDQAAWGAYLSDGGPEPGVRRSPHGFHARMDRARLRALGNSVVPQCAEVVGHIIRNLDPCLPPCRG